MTQLQVFAYFSFSMEGTQAQLASNRRLFPALPEGSAHIVAHKCRYNFPLGKPLAFPRRKWDWQTARQTCGESQSKQVLIMNVKGILSTRYQPRVDKDTLIFSSLWANVKTVVQNRSAQIAIFFSFTVYCTSIILILSCLLSLLYLVITTSSGRRATKESPPSRSKPNVSRQRPFYPVKEYSRARRCPRR